ncbi:MAG: RHS repeat protein [Gammaproteobacteria bacterium]|nr:RHS repeat protein [Gammaproteobacteria bacterium]
MGMKHSKGLTYLFPMVLLSALSTSPAESFADTLSSGASPNGEQLAFYATLVKETELRRRVNVLFPNPQSIFDGLQAGYVGVRNGNLTFRRRDIVAGHSLAIFSRVYDSRIQYTRDFGPGWRLAWAEEITAGDGGLIYTDGTGARHVFRLASRRETGNLPEALLSDMAIHFGTNGSRESAKVPSNSEIYTAYPATPQFAATTITITGSLAVLHNGIVTRIFKQHLDTTGAPGERVFLLSQVNTSNQTMMLSYRDGLIDAVSDPNGPVFSITRNRLGRVLSAQDHSGRSVSFAYDSNGRLTEAWDIGGNAWTYEYSPHGKLARVIGPNGKDVLRVTYDLMGRVVESESGRKYSLAYDAYETIVTEGTGHTHVFGHSAAGITDRFESTNGVWWRLTLDERNHVTGVRSSSGAYDYSYGSKGEIQQAIEASSAGTRNLIFDYNSSGEITRVSTGTGLSTAIDYAGGLKQMTGTEDPFVFELLPSRKIAFAHRNDTFISADYDSNGYLTALRNDAGVVTFDRDDKGRVSQIHYANGEVNQYSYDDLGNRSSVNFGSGGAVRYKHDPSGNLVEVTVTELNGEVRRQTVQIGDMNQVESITYHGADKLDIDYDSMGRAINFKMGADDVSVEYEGPDRIGRIYSRITGESWSPSTETDKSSGEVIADGRLDVILGDSDGPTQPDYGILGFADINFQPVARDPMEIGVPGLREARQFLAVAEPLLLSDNYSAMTSFEKPSNPVFQPLEYRSTNCCIWLPTGEHCEENYHTAGLCFCGPFLPGGGGCTDPDYSLPGSALPPTVSFIDTLPKRAGNFRWGIADVWYDDSSLGCWELCNGKFRLEGRIEVDDDRSFIIVTQMVPAVGRCRTAPRSDDNIANTFNHEYKHVDKLLDVIDAHNKMLGGQYDTFSKCETAMNNVKSSLNGAHGRERTRQLNHDDHRGERRHAAVCPRSGGPAIEIVCGLDRNYVCTQDFY